MFNQTRSFKIGNMQAQTLNLQRHASTDRERERETWREEKQVRSGERRACPESSPSLWKLRTEKREKQEEAKREY